MDYTQQLRAAHIASLKQQYLDAMQTAGVEYAQNEKEHQKGARTAYVEKMTGLRDRPQQLRSLGLSGGVEDEDLRSIVEEYRAKYEELKERQREFTDEYRREMEKQQRRMDAAVAEYNARCALEDYKAAQKSAGSSSSSGGSSRSSRSSRAYGSGNSGRTPAVSQQVSGSLQHAASGVQQQNILSGSHGSSGFYNHGGVR